MGFVTTIPFALSPSGFQALSYVLNRSNYCKSGPYISREYGNECIIISFSILRIHFGF